MDSDQEKSRTYRLCTLNTNDSCRTISIFCMNLRRSKIASAMWHRLCEHGKRLSALHVKRLPWAPLVGWDIMCDEKGLVLLEGNLGGSVGLHLVPIPTRLGWVDRDTALRWRQEVRRAFHSNYYARASKRAEDQKWIAPM